LENDELQLRDSRFPERAPKKVEHWRHKDLAGGGLADKEKKQKKGGLEEGDNNQKKNKKTTYEIKNGIKVM